MAAKLTLAALSAKMDAAQESQNEINAALLAALQSQPTGVTVEAEEAPAPKTVEAEEAPAPKTAKVKNLDGHGATNHFPASQVQRQIEAGQDGWNDISVADALEYKRGENNPGTSNWIVTSLDDDGGVFCRRP